ncbi:MAG: KUP/HAK/KT family potassium transporter, partial [Polyangiaceae bacterium]
MAGPDDSKHTAHSDAGHAGHAHGGPLVPTALAAIGVVFGDIGTSPLYTLQVASDAQPGVPLDRADIFGVISLIIWALILAVSVKYVSFVMQADNNGEGGILALLALLPKRKAAGIGVVALLVIAGAALLFGDGMITPAISVLSALEGLELTAPGFKPWVVPLTCVVLVGLFSIQRRGTGSVGKIFGPVMVTWFVTIG